MINPVHSPSNVPQPSAAQPTHQSPPVHQKNNPPQDTVQLSPQARAAGGDVDHDGDSR